MATIIGDASLFERCPTLEEREADAFMESLEVATDHFPRLLDSGETEAVQRVLKFGVTMFLRGHAAGADPWKTLS